MNKQPIFRSLIALAILLGIVWSCKKEDPAPVKSTEKAISTFAFSGISPAVNATISGTSISATVPFSVDVTTLAPTIALSPKATVSPASGSSQNFTNPVTYTVTAEDGTTQKYTVTVTKGAAPKSAEKSILTFGFNALSPAVAATIDATAKTISATLPAATDLTKLVPTITISDKATVSPASGVATDFSKEVSYTVTAEDASTVIWKVNVTKTAVANALNDLVFSGCTDNNLYAFDAQTGEVKWKFVAGADFYNGGTPAYENGILYVASLDKKLYALDAKTGIKKWEFLTGGEIYTAPLFYNGVVYCGSKDKKMYAVDAQTGVKKWEFLTGDEIFSSPTQLNGIIYFGSKDKKMYAVDAQTGVKKWEFLTGDWIISSPSVVNKIVYFGSNDKKCYALDAETGVKKWDFTAVDVVYYVTVDNDVVYAVGKNLYALEAQTGVKKWEFTVTNYINGTPQVANGLIYCGGSDNYLYAIDIKTGTQKWRYATLNYVYGSPVVANGIVYVGERQYQFYAIDALTGTKKWQFQSNSTFSSGACVLDKNGKVYYSGASGMQQ